MPNSVISDVVGMRAAPSDEVAVERGEDGVWRYAGTSIPAVGAKDRTLAEVLQVRELAIAGETPEAVLLPLSQIVGDSRLNWALQAGTRLRGGEEDLFSIPWPVWQERAAEPVDAWLPERDTDGLNRKLAMAERDVRFLRQALEASTARRSELALLGTNLGMTRRQIAQMLGLSAGRAQQLYDEADDEQNAAVRRTLDDAACVVASANENQEINPSEVELPSGWSQEKLEDVLARLVDVGFLDRQKNSDSLNVTEAAMTLASDGSRGPASRARKKDRAGA